MRKIKIDKNVLSRTYMSLIIICSIILFSAVVASAEDKTYYWTNSNGESINGFTTNWTSCGAIPNGYKITSLNSSASSCTNSNLSRTSAGDLFLAIFPTAYSSDTDIRGKSGANFSLRGNGIPATYIFDLGFVQAGTFTSFGNITQTNVQISSYVRYTMDMSSISGTAPTGSNLALKVSVTTSGGGRISLGTDGGSIINSNSGRFYVNETSLVPPSTPMYNVTISAIPATGDIYAGNSYIYSITVNNIGNTRGNYILGIEDSDTTNFITSTLGTTTMNINSGSSAETTLTVSANTGATIGAIDITTVNVTSVEDSAYTNSTQVSTTVITQPPFEANRQISVNTNRLTILDDPSGWVYSWGDQVARGNQVLGDETTVKWYALVIDPNGTTVPGATVSTNLRYPNGTVYYSTTGITGDNGTVGFSRDLDNLNQRPYFATITEGYWRVDVSTTVNGQPISSSTKFTYDEFGCGKSGSACHMSQDWQATGASTKNMTRNGGEWTSPSKNSPYVQNRDKIHGSVNGHGHVTPSPQILSGECLTCHKSYDGTYRMGSTRQNYMPQYPNGAHQNRVSCVECHGIYNTNSGSEVFDMPVKKCYDCHPQLNYNLEIMDYIQDPTNSYSYNPLSTSNTIKGHNGNIPCITCHNNGHNITKPYIGPSNEITEYQQCLTCHSTYQNHNSGVDCTVCHSQDAHVIKIFSQSADYVVGKSNPSRGNCTNCHEDPTFINTLEGQPKAGSYTGDAPQIGNNFNHSTGEKWNRSGNLFWTDQLTACKYCHGDTKHNTGAFGKPEGFKGSNTINGYGTWCGSCHYSGNGQYSNMLGTMNLIPPEITGDPTNGNYAGGYFDHSGISGFQDSTCRGCHGNRPNLTLFMHNAGPGTEGGPDCVSCHNVGSGGDQPHINVSAMNRSDSIHKDLNSGAVTSINAENKRCWACHGNGDEPERHPDNYKTPYNCTDCHTGSNRNFTPPDTIKVVSEHYWSGDQIITSGVTSCYRCHNRSDMMIIANDPDLGTVYGGTNNGDNSTSHYGKKRTDLVGMVGSGQYCNYCHNSTIDSFFDVFVDVYNTDIQNHSAYGTNPRCQDCHGTTGTERIHDSNLTFSELVLPTSTICLQCHGPGGTASIKDKSKHNNSVNCSVCHLGTGKDIHPIKYLNNTGGFNTNRLQGVKCDRCHETGLYNAPAIGKVKHSDNTWNGSLWSIGASRPLEFWDNNSLYTACNYCHGNSKHNVSALGRLTGVRGSNSVNVFGTWCGICHYQGNSQFSGMIGVMSSVGIPPEISRHTTYGSYVNARDGTPYFNHSLNSYIDTRCDDCHYSGTPPNLTKSMHNVVVGGSSCLGCHAVDVDTTKMGKHANVSKVGSGVTDDDCKGCHFNVLTLGQMVDGYANFSNTYYCQDCHAPGGRNVAQYNNITNVTLRKSAMPPGHAQGNCTACHIPEGSYHPNGPLGTAAGKNCYSCHYRSDGTGGTLNSANIGLNDGPSHAPGEDHRCGAITGCHGGGGAIYRPPLTGEEGCTHCHGAGANNHGGVTSGDHYNQVVTLSSVTVDTPVSSGAIANVTGTVTNNFVQVAKAQYRINNSADNLIVRDWAEMNATDGKFNGRIEDIKGRIDTTGLSAGTYNVKVRGMISGYWATGGSGHNAALPYYPDNGLWTNTVNVTMNVTGGGTPTPTPTPTPNPNPTWSGWTLLDGLSPTSPSLAVFNNRLYASIKGTNDIMYIKSMYTNGVWTYWNRITNDNQWLTGPAITTYNGRLYDMEVNKSYNIYINSMGTNNVWSGWTKLDGLSPTSPSLAVFNNRLYASVKGTNDIMYIKSMDTNGVWTYWNRITNDNQWLTGPAITTYNGRLYIMAINKSYNIYINSMGTNNVWSGWTKLDGLSPTSPSLAVFNNRLYASIKGTNDIMYIKSMDTNGVWTYWNRITNDNQWLTGPAISTYNNRLYNMAVNKSYYIFINSLG